MDDNAVLASLLVTRLQQALSDRGESPVTTLLRSVMRAAVTAAVNVN
jgi:hypothetical protein